MEKKKRERQKSKKRERDRNTFGEQKHTHIFEQDDLDLKGAYSVV